MLRDSPAGSVPRKKKPKADCSHFDAIMNSIVINKDVNGILHSILKKLECPVCLEVVSAPIELCQNGHSVCPNCRRQLRQCSICRGRFSGIRCRTLEDIVSSFSKRKCKNASRGCPEKLNIEEMKKHEKRCALNMYECWICLEKITYVNLKEHCKTEHPDYTVHSGLDLDMWSEEYHDTGEDDMFLMQAYNELFWIVRTNVKRAGYIYAESVRDVVGVATFMYQVKFYFGDEESVMRGLVHPPGTHDLDDAPCEDCAWVTDYYPKPNDDSTFRVSIIKA